MGRLSIARRFSAVVLPLALVACGASEPAVLADGSNALPPLSRYDLANRCFALKANGSYVARDGASFVANTADAASAERFFMKPAGLGRYVFYTSDAQYLTGSGGAVSAVAAPEDGSDWTVTMSGDRYAASTLNLALAVGGTGQLLLDDAPAVLVFEPASGCTVYPEMPVGVTGKTFSNPTPTTPVIGFAEVHSHMAMGSDMSDGSGNRGPSAGGVMYGHAANRFGVVEALKNCANMHGEDGTASPENAVLDSDPTQTHDTVGWPTFIGWPQKDSQLHQQMYYKWVERAYKAGLRTMTVLGTNIEALCNVAKESGGDKDTDPNDVDCIDMGVGTKQVEYLYDIEKYVDAQEGGPGKGWYRIVKDPAEARAVIAQGKLAVIPGLEFANIFHCNVMYNDDGSETRGCTKEDIDREIDAAWELGVRQVFPYHDVDSALGGAGIFSATLNLINYYGTNGYWKTYNCDDGGVGPTFFYEAGAELPSGPFFGDDPITQAMIERTQGRTPSYPPERQCNARTVTDLGRYAIDKIMKKGFVFDIDHAEIRSKQYMLDEAAKLSPDYPMISGHGGHGGINNAQAAQIIRQGGILYPALPNGKDFTDFLNKLKPVWQASGTTRPIALGYGADANGLRNLPGPRGAGTTPIKYPFTLFQGPGWGPQFEAAGITPIKVDLLAIPGGQSWNMDEVGMANYGLVADIVEEVRIEGGTEGISALYRSAEAYLQLWEQTLAASEDARHKPVPQ